MVEVHCLELMYGLGMFLWVRLVLDSLETVYSLKELRKIVEVLPSGLFEL